MTPDAPLLQAAPNFRDFGGPTTTDGMRVRRGALFRSELLLELTAEDHKVLGKLGIGVVCDLRSPAERRRLVGDWPPGLDVEHLALDIDAELSSVQPDKWSRHLKQPDFGAEQAREAMIENYRRMPAAYRRDLHALFEYLLRPDARGVLIHCAVGKDRTGFVSGMLLSALGVSIESVLDDYLLTNQRFPAEKMIEQRNRFLPIDRLDDRMRAALGVLVCADPDYLQAAFDVVRDEFGGVSAYLEDECGLAPTHREALRARLLES